MGARAYNRFSRDGNQIQGFLVTDIAGNPKKLFGLPVINQSEVNPEEDELVVVAVSTTLQDEICSLLEERGCSYAIYPTWR